MQRLLLQEVSMKDSNKTSTASPGEAVENSIPAEVLAEATELCRGAEVLPGGMLGLAAKLHEARSAGRVLRVKLGVDPTSCNLHLGHAVVLRVLRRFQDFGHQVVIIIGGFTAQIGDPSGRNATRPALTQAEVAANAQTYLAQIGLVIDLAKAEVVNNSDWLATMNLTRVLELASRVTVNQLLAKEGFGERLEKNQPLALHEVMYPLLQGFDSVSVKADVEIGGTDQRFNLLSGRQLQPFFQQSPQVVMMMPLLVGTDGVRKMSKSFGNHIGLTEPASDMFAKVMRIGDGQIITFFELATSASQEEIEKVRQALAAGSNPKDAKELLAQTVIRQFHGQAAADEALAGWRRVHSQRLAPEEMPSHGVAEPKGLAKLMVELGLAESNTRARKLIEGKAVSIDGEKVLDVNFQVAVPPEAGSVLQVGRRHFVRLVRI
jgi:tyrosyl-tRNA synthetase